MAVLHLLWDRSEPLSAAPGPPGETRTRIALLFAALLAVACADAPDPRLRPDELLREELGLTAEDRVHRIRVSGGEVESADPVLVSIEQGAYVEFTTVDWLVHEVVFVSDSLGAEQWSFLEKTDQVASPPLVDRGSRYVLGFAGAPPGRYIYTLEGNGRAGGGVILVIPPGAP